MALWILCLLGLSGWLTACGQHTGEDRSETRPVLHYSTWSDYVSADIIQEFERREQVKVVIDTFSSNEELLAKLQSGATGYDVAVPSDFMVAIMIQQGLLSELDQAELSNALQLEPHLQTLPFDPERRYSVPYLWGTVGIGYDSAVIPTAPDSWSILWDMRYKGRISMLNDQREVFGAVLRSMGQSGQTNIEGVLISLSERLIFKNDQVELPAEALQVLDTIAEMLGLISNKVRLVGHTNNSPSTNPAYPTNWELSLARATTVAKYLINAGLAPERFIISGQGEYAPVFPNDTDQHKEMNARVEIIIIYKIDSNVIDINSPSIVP